MKVVDAGKKRKYIKPIIVSEVIDKSTSFSACCTTKLTLQSCGVRYKNATSG